MQRIDACRSGAAVFADLRQAAPARERPGRSGQGRVRADGGRSGEDGDCGGVCRAGGEAVVSVLIASVVRYLP